MAKFYTTCSWDQVPHLSKEAVDDMMAALPPHQRDARSKGIPALGSGAIYPVPEEDITVKPFELPVYWRRAYGLDVGWNRTAAIWGAYDEQTDVLYLYSEHYRGQAEPSIHAEAIKARGQLKGVIDPASRGRGQKDGEQLLQNYIDLGLSLSLANNGVESGIFDVYQRLSTGRLKVFSTLQNWLQEYRVYRRDDNGRVVKEGDHLMDACVTKDTLVCTTKGKVPIIELIGKTGEVISRDGSALKFIGARKTIENSPVVRLEFENGDIVRCTPDHPFLTTNGWVKAIDMMDAFCYNAVAQKEGIWKLHTAKPFTALSTHIPMDISSVRECGICIVLFTREKLEKFLKDGWCITKTGIDLIMNYLTLKLWMPSNIALCTVNDAKVLPPYGLSRRPKRGMDLPRVLNGIESTIKEWGVSKNRDPSCAKTAKVNSPPTILAQTGFVPMPAKLGCVGILALTMRNVIAWRVAQSSKLISTLRRKPAQKNVLVKCVAVQNAGYEDVYCLTVPGVSAFTIASGLVVHNTRYLVVSGIGIADFPQEYRQSAINLRAENHTADYNPLSRAVARGIKR